MKVTALAVLWAGLVLGVFGRGASSWGEMSVAMKPSPQEIESLPEFCKVQQFMWKYLSPYQKKKLAPKRKSLEKKWRTFFGSGYLHVHHYCWGLAQLTRAMQPPDGTRTYEMRRNTNLQMAIQNFDYVLRNVNGNCPIVPQVYYKKSQALLLLGRIQESQVYFNAAQKWLKKRSHKRP